MFWLIRLVFYASSAFIYYLLNTSFSGGVFEFKDESQCNFEQIGDTVIFASHLQHRVTPVTSGIRHSLVSWIRGE